MLGWIIMIACLCALYSFLFERHWLDVRHVQISLKDLPDSFKGLRIAHFSDTHMGFYYQPKQLTLLIDKINRLKPDVICFTGDLLNDPSSREVLVPTVQQLTRLQASLGKVAVVGNHDYYAGINDVVKGLQEGGFKVLQNEHFIVTRGQDYLTFIGLDDVLYGKPDPTKALENTPENGGKILLVHEPDFAQDSTLPISLQLSGHSHGGQVCVPFWGPILTTRMGRKFTNGLYTGRNGIVYTNRGIGTTHLPIRFCCRPELTLITLEV